MDFKGILSSLPPVDFGFAYGSGVLEQHGYDNRATNPPMIDLVVATSNSTRWHEDNLERNASHYSGIRVVGAGALAAFQDNYGAGIFYNPLVPLPPAANGAPNQKMKYGVISVHTLVDDLLHWRTMYVSGRMHKPVRIISCAHEVILQAARENLRHALRVSLLMLPPTFTAQELYMTIAGLSYTGDFRMVFGENPNKVANIVLKSLDHFHSLYSPVLEISFPTVNQVASSAAHASVANIRYSQDTSPEARLAMCLSLPIHLQRRMATAYNEARFGTSGGVYSSLLQRLRPTQGTGAASTRSLKDWMHAGVGAHVDSRNTAVATPTVRSPLTLASEGSEGYKFGREPLPGQWGLGGGSAGLSFLHARGARAVTLAEAGREMMRRVRLQRLQFRVSKQQRASERVSSKSPTTDSSPLILEDAKLTSEQAKHYSETDAGLGQLNYAKASQDTRIVAFWDEMLKVDFVQQSAFLQTQTHLDSAASTPPFRYMDPTRTSRFGPPGPSILVGNYLRPAVAHIVGVHARSQSAKGIITGGPVKSFVYALQKLDKYVQGMLTKFKRR